VSCHSNDRSLSCYVPSRLRSNRRTHTVRSVTTEVKREVDRTLTWRVSGLATASSGCWSYSAGKWMIWTLGSSVDEPVAETNDRLDLMAGRTKLVPKAANMNVDGPVFDHLVVAPHALEQSIARDDAGEDRSGRRTVPLTSAGQAVDRSPTNGRVGAAHVATAVTPLQKRYRHHVC